MCHRTFFLCLHRTGRLLGVCASVDNCRLFVGGIPKTKKREEIMCEMRKVTEGVVDVIVYPSAADKSKNRGFAFVEYESHRAAAMARRKLLPGEAQRSQLGLKSLVWDTMTPRQVSHLSAKVNLGVISKTGFKKTDKVPVLQPQLFY